MTLYILKVQRKYKKKTLRKVLDGSIRDGRAKKKKVFIRRSFIDFQIWDFPGQVDYFDSMAYDAREIFDTLGSLVFVIDAQDDYSDAISRLQYTITEAYKVNPQITFEVLIHKVDGLSDDYRDGNKASFNKWF